MRRSARFRSCAASRWEMLPPQCRAAPRRRRRRQAASVERGRRRSPTCSGRPCARIGGRAMRVGGEMERRRARVPGLYRDLSPPRLRHIRILRRLQLNRRRPVSLRRHLRLLRHHLRLLRLSVRRRDPEKGRATRTTFTPGQAGAARRRTTGITAAVVATMSARRTPTTVSETRETRTTATTAATNTATATGTGTRA